MAVEYTNVVWMKFAKSRINEIVDNNSPYQTINREGFTWL